MKKFFDSQYLYFYIIFIFNLFNIVKCNKYPLKNSTLKKSNSENDVNIFSNKSLKNKLYRTDKSYIYHLVKDNNYHICDNISYKKIDNFYKDHPVPIHCNSISSPPTSSPPVEKKNINYYNEYYHDF
jgi:hypothetical protein